MCVCSIFVSIMTVDWFCSAEFEKYVRRVWLPLPFINDRIKNVYESIVHLNKYVFRYR